MHGISGKLQKENGGENSQHDREQNIRPHQCIDALPDVRVPHAFRMVELDAGAVNVAKAQKNPCHQNERYRLNGDGYCEHEHRE